MTFVPSEEYTTFVSTKYTDGEAAGNDTIAQAMLKRVLSTFSAFIPYELHAVLSNRPAASNTWFPTMIVCADINLCPVSDHQMYVPVPNKDHSLPQIVLLKEGTTNGRVWATRRTVDIKKLPG